MNPLGLENVAGVFVVTILGCAIASIFAVLEFLVGTRQSAKVYHICTALQVCTLSSFSH